MESIFVTFLITAVELLSALCIVQESRKNATPLNCKLIAHLQLGPYAGDLGCYPVIQMCSDVSWLLFLLSRTEEKNGLFYCVFYFNIRIERSNIESVGYFTEQQTLLLNHKLNPYSDALINL